MNDLIGRQAAIDLFPNDALEWDTYRGYIAPHLARRMIEELPSAQPEIIRCKDCKHWYCYGDETFCSELGIYGTNIDRQPTVDAIPVAFIESEKQRVQGMMEYAVKMGMIAESERLASVIAVLDAVVSNWRYTTGSDWRAEREEK